MKIKTTPYRVLEEVVNHLLSGSRRKFKRKGYTVNKGAVFHESNRYDPLMRKVGKNVFCNTGEIELNRTEHVGGRDHLQTKLQKLVEDKFHDRVVQIPFNLEVDGVDGELDLKRVKIIDRGPKYEGTRIKQSVDLRKYLKAGPKRRSKMLEKFHFMGALLFRIGDRHFLLDIDRKEIEGHLQNTFLCEVPGSPKSVGQAYDGLMPEEVRKAIAKGLDVKRQGEYYFVPASTAELRKARYSNDQYRALRNHSSDGLRIKERKKKSDVFYAEGEVTHDEDEHLPITLDTPHRIVVNKAKGSHNLRGGVD